MFFWKNTKSLCSEYKFSLNDNIRKSENGIKGREIKKKRCTSKSLKNKCVSARLKIISSILSPNETDVGGSWKKNREKYDYTK